MRTKTRKSEDIFENLWKSRLLVVGSWRNILRNFTIIWLQERNVTYYPHFSYWKWWSRSIWAAIQSLKASFTFLIKTLSFQSMSTITWEINSVLGKGLGSWPDSELKSLTMFLGRRTQFCFQSSQSRMVVLNVSLMTWVFTTDL